MTDFEIISIFLMVIGFIVAAIKK